MICEEDLGVRMDDGVQLLADRWVARDSASEAQPTVLVRSSGQHRARAPQVSQRDAAKGRATAQRPLGKVDRAQSLTRS